MTDEFDFLTDDDDEDGELPDWLSDFGSEDDDELGFEDDEPTGDEFDMLRERTARASEAYDDIDDADEGGGLQGFMGALSSGQRTILALLVLMNIVAFICGAFVFTGMVTLF